MVGSPPVFPSQSMPGDIGFTFMQASGKLAGQGQGLTLVHFSVQPEPFLTVNTRLTPPTAP